MNILRLQPIQLLIRFHAQPASESHIKIHRVLRRRSRNVERAGAEVAGLGGGEVEEVGAEAAATVGVAEVEELQLQPVALGAEAARVEDYRADQAALVEQAEEPAAAVEAVEQDRRVMLGLALRPAAHVVELGAQHQLAGLDGIQVFDHFAAVDLPDQGDFVAAQQAFFGHRGFLALRPYISGRRGRSAGGSMRPPPPSRMPSKPAQPLA